MNVLFSMQVKRWVVQGVGLWKPAFLTKFTALEFFIYCTNTIIAQRFVIGLFSPFYLRIHNRIVYGMPTISSLSRCQLITLMRTVSLSQTEYLCILTHKKRREKRRLDYATSSYFLLNERRNPYNYLCNWPQNHLKWKKNEGGLRLCGENAILMIFVNAAKSKSLASKFSGQRDEDGDVNVLSKMSRLWSCGNLAQSEILWDQRRHLSTWAWKFTSSQT